MDNSLQPEKAGKRIGVYVPPLNSDQIANVKRLYLAGLNGSQIAKVTGIPKGKVERQVKRLQVESTGLDVFAFKSVLSVRLCGIIDRHEGAVCLLAAESVRVSGAIAAIDSELADLGIPPDRSALLLQVRRDKQGVPLASCRIAALCRAMLHRPDHLSGAIALAESRAALAAQADRLAVAMLKADQSLADSLGKVGVAAIRAAGENTGPTPSSANNKNAKLSPPVSFKDDELVNGEIMESRARYEEYLRTAGPVDVKAGEKGGTEAAQAGSGAISDVGHGAVEAGAEVVSGFEAPTLGDAGGGVSDVAAEADSDVRDTDD